MRETRLAADREGERGTADDDVLRRRALQPHRVDERVAREAGEREEGERAILNDLNDKLNALVELEITPK